MYNTQVNFEMKEKTMKNKKTSVVLFIVLGTLLLVACNGSGDPTDESSYEDVINQAYTQAAETNQAKIALTSAAQPQPTNTMFSLSSPTPVGFITNTPLSVPTFSIPTLPPLPSPTFTTAGSQPGYVGGRPCLRTELLYERPKDGAKFKPGESLRKLWIFSNSGGCKWTDKFSIIFVGGTNFAGRGIFYFHEILDVPDIGYPNGAKVEIGLSMEAPAHPGHYIGYWMLRDDNGNLFGVGGLGDEVFWVDIYVRE
jgi:hypothetical protein